MLIAERLGISAATVSRALRPETADLVKESTRQEIQRLAEDLKFVPNVGARMLLGGLNPTLVVVVPRDEEIFFSEFYGRLMVGILRAVAETEWEVRIATLAPSSSSLVETLQPLGQGSSGIIYAGTPLDAEQFQELSDYKRPLVVFASALPPGHIASSQSCDVLGVDNRQGAIAAVEHLVSLGHRKIGILCGPVESRDFSERLEGYLAGLERSGIPLPEHYIQSGSFDMPSGREGCRKLLEGEVPPTAILCANDYLALGALDYAKEAGLSCPKEISIIGFDDGPWAETSFPPLTTVRQPLRRLAGRAVELLIAAATGGKMGDLPNHVQLNAELVVRASSGKAP